MKSLLKEQYNINALSFIKLSDKAYKVKTDNEDYILKYIDNSNLEMIIEKIRILNIDAILLPIPNKSNNYTCNYNNNLFVLYICLQEERTSLNDLKIKFYLENLSIIHNKTYYPLKVNNSFFKDTYEYIGEIIDESEKKIEEYMNHIESLDYKSPSQWLFLLNYPLYIKSIDSANSTLENFKNISYSKNSVRMAFTFNNFNYKHIFLKEGKIIGIDNITLSSPIYDIFYTLSTIESTNLDIQSYYIKYFKSFILEDYEKEWLYSLLYIPKLEISNNESDNIKNIVLSLEYLKSSYEIIETLKNINLD